MKILEPQIDKLFDDNPILRQPFLHVYNHFCQVATFQFIQEKQAPHSFAIPYTFVFERMNDFSPQSPESCDDFLRKLNPDDFKNLFACANLNIVIPFIRSKIYRFTRESSEKSTIDYADEITLKHEINDIIVTHLSLPVISNQAHDSRPWLKSVVNRLKTNKPVNPTFYFDYISEQYKASENAFIEADIIPPDFYTQIGFSSADAFKKIRNAFICIGQIYNDITFIVYKYLEVNELKDSGDGDHHLQGLGMARLGAAELKFLVQKLTGVAESDYDKFSEFFFCGEGKNGSLSLKFMPPFWSISDDVYFCPALVPTLLGTRNLLISILIDDDKNTKYNYDGLISHFFEPELLRRAQRHFESNGFYTYLECDFTGGEIDLLVFCNKFNTVMTVQAKATLYPESARMVRRLDDRIREAVEQTKRFDKLEPKEKTSLFKKSFPSLDDSAQINHIRAVLTNSSFGSTFSWQLLESNKITPINCNLLKNVLPCCNVLTELPEQIEAFIAKIKSEIEITEEQKVFSLPGHTIYQRHVETHRMKNLYDAKYWGE
ncbi:hypothetical protein CXF92_10310 [Pseudomonas sp. Choline-3u-10]|jgi:hypothetical protein|uniref:hypothetical protein n=1 Tax=Pseudomonadaceae TaxID=135621 RepID=UPI000535B8C6|nr:MULTISPECIES: hypothetical protein [Pseudomonadaceae]BAP80170.1 hypothetical protein MT1_2995 [Pseudomonas sp. MT-1]HBM09187.1 hypothetical protein [Pseudomonas sp.]MBK3796932.1 hypothetical protein [Stutzerimonas stutzeri]MBK3877435.1 hypothetical protein [Stutzerimonas stutzeri]MCQ4283505.1 hypothetical protein [Stutzerimonas stutzeri]|tara:strand:+ start:1697 stop:3334 length:1638 start_codon:yes stop_codon:yes gene_type:complete